MESFIVAIIITYLAIRMFGKRRRPNIRDETTWEWYQRMLLDPRWIRKRDRILKRDNYTCRGRRCKSTDRLQVHHIWYNGDPWDVPDRALITLCYKCHKKEHR